MCLGSFIVDLVSNVYYATILSRMYLLRSSYWSEVVQFCGYADNTQDVVCFVVVRIFEEKNDGINEELKFL